MTKNLENLLIMMERDIQQPWNCAVEPFRIADGLYYVGTTYVSNYLLDSGEGLILIDTGVPEMLYLLLESIRKLGFDPKDIKIVLLTHAHFDHCGATRHIKEMTGAKVLLGMDDVPNLDSRKELMIKEIAPFTVDNTYDYEKRIQMGSFSIECVHTPAHTMGSTSFFFNVNDSGNTYKCGLHGGVGLVTLDREYLLEHNLPIEYQTIYLNSLASLKYISVDILLPSHNSHYDILKKAAKGETEAFVDAAAWGEFIDSRIEIANQRFNEYKKG